jgi:hypothetical protein
MNPDYSVVKSAVFGVFLLERQDIMCNCGTDEPFNGNNSFFGRLAAKMRHSEQEQEQAKKMAEAAASLQEEVYTAMLNQHRIRCGVDPAVPGGDKTCSTIYENMKKQKRKKIVCKVTKSKLL